MNCPRKLGLGGLGFTHALLQTFSATMTAAGNLELGKNMMGLPESRAEG